MKRQSFWWMSLAAIALMLSIFFGSTWKRVGVAIPTNPLEIAQTTEEADVVEDAEAVEDVETVEDAETIQDVETGEGTEAEGTETAPALEEGAEVNPDLESELIVSGLYEDPQGKFQIGILDGYAVSTAAGSPLFQLGDGSLAYSVIRVPLDSESPLAEIGLVEIAQQTLGRGEGFQTQTFSTVPGGGLQIFWTGRFSRQSSAPPQPISGTLLVKQQGAEAYLLIVAAFEDAVAQVPRIITTLTNTLVIL
ncbi:MAG: hypothetical protein F6K42_03365 [Leptolyngbya sp. SIO1D8]|nr:hypothetical protein [Leptolyngbya sp. SIO1D8]